ncbi:hypothetical protein [Haladaptatus sp. DFWS20]|uniref:hypothetical protein n=1 Tax=Haladaptatus sp. DFWS20 TaxID=3403467 RepID=UPI003EBB1322
MLHSEALSLLIGAVILGAVHGIEPGHGWPVAAAYALDQTNKWFYGFASSLILGVGHLISSLAMVAVFFYAKSYFNLTQVNQPITIFGGIQIGGPVSLVAGVLLILLGIREYFGHSHGHSHSDNHSHDGHSHDDEHSHEGDHTHGHGRSHGNGHSHEDRHSHGMMLLTPENRHSHDEHAHHSNHGQESHEHSEHPENNSGVLARLKGVFTGGGHSHDHSHGELDEAANRGLLGIAWFAFILGFAHEEEFEIIALCAGSSYCLELMSAYAITVILGIVGLTMLLVAGYTHYEDRVERYTPYLPLFSAAVLIIMGFGFISGLY